MEDSNAERVKDDECDDNHPAHKKQKVRYQRSEVRHHSRSILYLTLDISYLTSDLALVPKRLGVFRYFLNCVTTAAPSDNCDSSQHQHCRPNYSRTYRFPQQQWSKHESD